MSEKRLSAPMQELEIVSLAQRQYEKGIRDTVGMGSVRMVVAIQDILSTLDFCLAPNWIEVLKKRRAALETAYHDAQEMVNKLYRAQIGYMARKGIVMNLPEFRLVVMEFITPDLSPLQDAIADAIEGDNGAALREYAKEWAWSEFTQRAYELDSALSLALETKTEQHTLYLGKRLIAFGRQGIGPTRAWPKIYTELQIKASKGLRKMDDDEMAAWEWLQRVDPHHMKPAELNDWIVQLRNIKKRFAKLSK